MKKFLVLSVFILLAITSIAQSNSPIEIELPSKIINGTKLLMKARLSTMLYSQESKYVLLNWKVSYYSDSAGHYGQQINLPGISSYNKESIANNSVMVNPETGAFVEKDEDGNYPEGSVGQYDFFYYLAENENINVHNLIRVYGAAVSSW